MRQSKKNPRSVNRWMLHSSVAAVWSYALWPTTSSSLLDFVLPFATGFIALGGVGRAAKGLFLDYKIRQTLSNASKTSGTFGKADFASVQERQNAGLHDLSGLAFLGLADSLPTLLPNGNILIEAMQGSGKTSRILVMTIIQTLMTGRSAFVADSKPELVHMLGGYLRDLGFRVVINNPSFKDGIPHQDSNPFQTLVEAVADQQRSHEAFPIAEALAKVIVPDASDGKAKFFTQIDQQVLQTVLLGLAVLRPSRCYPAQLWKHLTDPDAFEHLLFEAKDSDALHGDLATMARSLLQKDRDNPEHLEGGRTGAANALSPFKPSSSLGQYGANHSYDIADARNKSLPPMVVFDIMPADQLDVFAKAYELTNTARLISLKRASKGREVVMVADEFTALPIRPIATEIEFIRSFGIRLVAAYQSWASLKRVYGEARAESLKANCAQLYFSVNDLKTAKEISERVGDHTVKTESFGFSGEPEPSKNVSETGRRLLPPEELMSLSRDQAILMIPGMCPVKLQTVPWYEINPIKDALGENPHELHQKSKASKLTINYSRDANALASPVVPDFNERLARASKVNRGKDATIRVRWLRPQKFLWVPLVSAFVAFALLKGTPHIGWMQSPQSAGYWRCGYLGIAGLEIVGSNRGCPGIAWIPPHSDELS